MEDEQISLLGRNPLQAGKDVARDDLDSPFYAAAAPFLGGHEERRTYYCEPTDMATR